MTDKAPDPNNENDDDLNIGDTLETQHVSTAYDYEEDTLFPNELETRPALQAARRTIHIYVPQVTDPLRFFNPERIVMGRGGPDLQLDVDLSANYGWMLGVSREHAEIVYEDDQYYVADLSSTNGTWLNSTRLVAGERYPLESSDQIRMGHFLMIVQYD
ncbi:MAG: FHA domain-containing protein [Chloroflexota bacterium]